MFKNKWLLIGLILMTIFSSIGNSVTVIAETLDSSSLETSETLDEQELSSDIGVENENPTVESAVQEMVMGDSQVDKEMKSLDSIEIQGQTRDWSPSTSIQAEAVRNWVSQQLDSYFNLSNEKLGRNVGDKIVKTINFPEYMGIAAYKGEGNWNGQWYIQLGKTKLDSNGYFKFSNFSFTHSSDISVSLSGSDTDKTRRLTITRLKKSPDERYSIKANYYFESRGVMYNDFGIISGKYNTIYPNGDGKQIDMDLKAVPQLTGRIQVREKLVNGNYVYYDYEVPFTVKDDLKISANPNKKTINLGSDFSKVSPYDLATDVKLGNQILNKDDYTVSVQNTVETDTIGDKIAKILITYKKNTSKTLSLDVPVNILWGNSVVYGSYDYYGSGRTSAAFTLNHDGNPYIVASQGKDDDNGEIHSRFRNEKYYEFNWINMMNKDKFTISENELGDGYIQANGDDLKRDKLKEWGNNQKQEVHYGDVVRAWQVEPSKNWLYENEQRNSYNKGNQSVYYEITKNGYRTLHLNHLEAKKVTIPIYSTEEYLDKNIKDYIDLKGYSNISVKEFSQYPNTKASGQQKGKIIVEETLTTGKKAQYEYEVTFIIGEGELTYSVPKTLTFKEFTKSKSEQTIQRMYAGDLGLKISDNRGQGKQGNWRLTAQMNQSEELSPYLIFRDGTSQDKYLNQGAVEIYSQAKQSNPAEPLNVEVSDQWLKDTGILLKVPSKNHLSSKQYTSKITWNLVEGP